MFDGEYISLDVLNAMETVRVPKPIKVVSDNVSFKAGTSIAREKKPSSDT